MSFQDSLQLMLKGYKFILIRPYLCTDWFICNFKFFGRSFREAFGGFQPVVRTVFEQCLAGVWGVLGGILAICWQVFRGKNVESNKKQR